MVTNLLPLINVVAWSFSTVSLSVADPHGYVNGVQDPHGYWGPFRNITPAPSTTTERLQKSVAAGHTCKDMGSCLPGLTCCNVGDGNRCWECCEHIHCSHLGKVCW